MVASQYPWMLQGLGLVLEAQGDEGMHTYCTGLKQRLRLDNPETACSASHDDDLARQVEVGQRSGSRVPLAILRVPTYGRCLRGDREERSDYPSGCYGRRLERRTG